MPGKKIQGKRLSISEIFINLLVWRGLKLSKIKRIFQSVGWKMTPFQQSWASGVLDSISRNIKLNQKTCQSSIFPRH